MHACMHVCMYICISVRWWLASGMHANAFHCVRVMVTSLCACTKAILSGPCNAWLMIDGWMIVMNGSGDAWFVLVKE